MAKTISAPLIASGYTFAVLVSRFNEFITSRLLAACLDALERHGASSEALEVIWCPGAFELPFVAKQAAASQKYDAIICLGAIIRGATPHFDYVASECAKGIAQVGLDSGLPTVFGVITADSIEQAVERAGTKAGNKGADAALTAIEMVNLVRLMSAPELVKKNGRLERGHKGSLSAGQQLPGTAIPK